LVKDGNDGLQGQQMLLLNQFLQRLSLQILHRQIEKFIVLSEIVDGDDVRMGQDAGGARFALEPCLIFLKLRRAQALNKKGLDGNGSPNDGIEALVDNAHRSPTQLACNFVASRLGKWSGHGGSSSPATSSRVNLARVRCIASACTPPSASRLS